MLRSYNDLTGWPASGAASGSATIIEVYLVSIRFAFSASRWCEKGSPRVAVAVEAEEDVVLVVFVDQKQQPPAEGVHKRDLYIAASPVTCHAQACCRCESPES